MLNPAAIFNAGDLLLNPTIDLLRRLAGQLERIADVVDRPAPRKQRVAIVLKHIADSGLAKGLSVKEHFAPIEGHQSGHHVDQGRFPAAIRAENTHDRMAGNVEIEVAIQRRGTEFLGQAANGDLRRAGTHARPLQ